MACNAYNHPPDCLCGFGGDAFEATAPRTNFLLHYGRSNMRLLDSATPSTIETCRPTTCPVCRGEVFFLRHNGGAFWVDELGVPWPIHGCFASNQRVGDGGKNQTKESSRVWGVVEAILHGSEAAPSKDVASIVSARTGLTGLITDLFSRSLDSPTGAPEQTGRYNLAVFTTASGSTLVERTFVDLEVGETCLLEWREEMEFHGMQASAHSTYRSSGVFQVRSDALLKLVCSTSLTGTHTVRVKWADRAMLLILEREACRDRWRDLHREHLQAEFKQALQARRRDVREVHGSYRPEPHARRHPADTEQAQRKLRERELRVEYVANHVGGFFLVQIRPGVGAPIPLVIAGGERGIFQSGDVVGLQARSLGPFTHQIVDAQGQSWNAIDVLHPPDELRLNVLPEPAHSVGVIIRHGDRFAQMVEADTPKRGWARVHYSNGQLSAVFLGAQTIVPWMRLPAVRLSSL